MCAFKWRHILVNAAAHMHVWSNFPRVLQEKRHITLKVVIAKSVQLK